MTRRTRNVCALTLLEVLITSAIFVLVSVVLFATVKAGLGALNSVEGRYDAQTQVSRAAAWIVPDLRAASKTAVGYKRVPGGGHGDALWMLSAVDPDTREYVRDAAGNPVWQRNVLYYLVRPSAASHPRLAAGGRCKVDDAAHPDGDVFCPHKLLLRKVIRKEAAGDPETLLDDAEIDAYLTEPDGHDTGAMYAEPGVEEVRLVGQRLLWFDVVDDRSPPADPPFYTLSFRSVRIRDAQARTALGGVPLETGRFTATFEARVEPLNP